MCGLSCFKTRAPAKESRLCVRKSERKCAREKRDAKGQRATRRTRETRHHTHMERNVSSSTMATSSCLRNSRKKGLPSLARIFANQAFPFHFGERSVTKPRKGLGVMQKGGVKNRLLVGPCVLGVEGRQGEGDNGSAWVVHLQGGRGSKPRCRLHHDVLHEVEHGLRPRLHNTYSKHDVYG